MCYPQGAGSQSAGPNQTASPADWWGGQNMRYGGPIGTPSNWTSAQQNLPGASDPNLLAATAMYGTPWQGNGVGSYGRWNWAQPQSAGQGQQGGGYQSGPGVPLIPPGTPPPAGTGTPTSVGGNGTGGVPSGVGLFGMTQDQQMGTARNPGAPSGGDIFTNPAFANAVQGQGGNGLFGPSAAADQLQQQKVQEALARRAARGV